MPQTHAAPAPGVPLHKHGEFHDLEAALNSIDLLSRALCGIGNLLQPESEHADEQLNLAWRSDASAVFEFFGKSLDEYREIAEQARETLQREAAVKGGAA